MACSASRGPLLWWRRWGEVDACEEASEPETRVARRSVAKAFIVTVVGVVCKRDRPRTMSNEQTDDARRDETRRERGALLVTSVVMVVYTKKPAVVERFRIGVEWKKGGERGAVERGEGVCGGCEEGEVRRRRCPGTGRQPASQNATKGGREGERERHPD